LLAANAAGEFAGIDEGVAQMVRVRETLEPNPDNAAVFAGAYARYGELYDRLAPMF
jgi:sugar (pentulose or hexulose) kinase